MRLRSIIKIEMLIDYNGKDVCVSYDSVNHHAQVDPTSLAQATRTTSEKVAFLRSFEDQVREIVKEIKQKVNEQIKNI